jgi:hypothetical protein
MPIDVSNLETELLGRKATSPLRDASDGHSGKLWTLRDGAAVNMDWYTALALEGRCFIVDTATGTTMDDLNDLWTTADPDLYLYVPKGLAVIPLYIELGFEDTSTAVVADIYALASNTEDADRSVTGTVETISCLRTDMPYATGCSAWSHVTACTEPAAGNYFEFWRPYAGFIDDEFNDSIPWRVPQPHGISWSAKEATIPPIICDGGCVAVWASVTAGTGFITMIWAEVDSAFIK